MRSILALLLALTCVNAPDWVFADPESGFQLAHRKYIQRIEFLFCQNLNLKFVQMENPAVIVLLRFAPDGKFETVQIEGGSGDPAFDMAAELA